MDTKMQICKRFHYESICSLGSKQCLLVLQSFCSIQLENLHLFTSLFTLVLMLRYVVQDIRFKKLAKNEGSIYHFSWGVPVIILFPQRGRYHFQPIFSKLLKRFTGKKSKNFSRGYGKNRCSYGPDMPALLRNLLLGCDNRLGPSKTGRSLKYSTNSSTCA